MTALAWYLLLTLLLSGATFLISRPGSRFAGSIALKRLLTNHAWITAVLAGIFLLYFLGWERSGAPPGSETAPYRLEHTGFYTGLGETLTFRSDDTSRAARLQALGAGESLRLTPNNEQGTLAWKLTANARSLPLRIGEICVNLPEERWFLPGDTLVVEDPDQKLFFSVQWLIDPESGSNRWLYNQGALHAEQQADDFAAPVLIEDRSLREGLRLSAMVQHRIPRLLHALEAVDTTEGSSWWRRLLQRESTLSQRLANGVDLKSVKERYRLLFPSTRSVLWIRKTLGDSGSPMGVFIDPGPLKTAPRFVRRGVGGDRELPALAGPGPTFDHDLPEGSRIRYGFGGADAATLILDSAIVRDRGLGLIAHVRLGSPPSWQLPERPADGFMIFSQEVLLQNIVGFQLDSGLDREPFYAKALYLPGQGMFEINDGKDFLGTAPGANKHPVQPPDEIFRLGGAQRGVALRFIRQASLVPFPGLLAILSLLLAAWAFSAEMQSDRSSPRPRLDLAWTLLWGLVVSLLVVRLILSYRVALLPPTDASPQEVSNVFHKSFQIAFAALASIPLLLVAVRWLAGAPRSVTRLGWQVNAVGGRLTGARPVRWASGSLAAFVRRTLPARVLSFLSTLPRSLLLTAGALILWIALGAITRRADLFGVRINIAAHLLILVGLVTSARWIVHQGRGERVSFALLWMLLPALLVMLLTGDLGFGIHLLSLGLAALLLAVWNRQRLRSAAVAALVGGTLLLVFAPALVPHLLRVPWIDHWVMKLSDPGERHFYYRLVVPEVDQEVLARPAEEDEYSMTYFLRNSQQHWQMMLYASEGAHLPRRYGNAPLSRIGMTYPTSMSDCVYAVYVLSEHGGWAGFLLLLVYAGLGAVSVFASAYLPDRERHRSLALIAVGAAFSLAAFYMACANLGLLVFTGQNLPLLSLVSRSDLIAGAALLAMTAGLLRYRLGGEQTVPFRSHPWVRRIAWGYLAVLGLGAAILAARLISIAGDETLREDFTLDDKVHGEFAANLPDPDKSTPLQLDGEELRVEAPDLLSWPERQFVRAFELHSDRYDPLAGFYYLEDVDGEPRLRINPTYLNLASP
ncbi:MAG TPA: hypothetical protein VLE27_04615, partial [Thermoanaerobaculia bacterium]|nr:hypothetical protein [Thermoanaerobaculia bacterium]